MPDTGLLDYGVAGFIAFISLVFAGGAIIWMRLRYQRQSELDKMSAQQLERDKEHIVEMEKFSRDMATEAVAALREMTATSATMGKTLEAINDRLGCHDTSIVNKSDTLAAALQFHEQESEKRAVRLERLIERSLLESKR